MSPPFKERRLKDHRGVETIPIGIRSKRGVGMVALEGVEPVVRDVRSKTHRHRSESFFPRQNEPRRIELCHWRPVNDRVFPSRSRPVPTAAMRHIHRPPRAVRLLPLTHAERRHVEQPLLEQQPLAHLGWTEITLLRKDQGPRLESRRESVCEVAGPEFHRNRLPIRVLLRIARIGRARFQKSEFRILVVPLADRSQHRPDGQRFLERHPQVKRPHLPVRRPPGCPVRRCPARIHHGEERLQR